MFLPHVCLSVYLFVGPACLPACLLACLSSVSLFRFLQITVLPINDRILQSALVPDKDAGGDREWGKEVQVDAAVSGVPRQESYPRRGHVAESV